MSEATGKDGRIARANAARRASGSPIPACDCSSPKAMRRPRSIRSRKSPGCRDAPSSTISPRRKTSCWPGNPGSARRCEPPYSLRRPTARRLTWRYRRCLAIVGQYQAADLYPHRAPACLDGSPRRQQSRQICGARTGRVRGFFGAVAHARSAPAPSPRCNGRHRRTAPRNGALDGARRRGAALRSHAPSLRRPQSGSRG